MKQAIVTGATGFIGARLVNMLLDNNVSVIALGRKDFPEVDSRRLAHRSNLQYLKVPMEDIRSLRLEVEKRGLDIGADCVFYNVAWGGVDRLSDMDAMAQSRNVAQSCFALEAAAELGCKKFIHVGTMEEPIAENYLWLDHRRNTEFNRHVVYSLAKIASRNALKALSSHFDIEVIFATNSHVMGPYDDKDSFLQVTLQKFKSGETEFNFSTGEQFFDVISVDDCARAYMLIGYHGREHCEYWIGSGEARPLKEYVCAMASLYAPQAELRFGSFPYNDISMRLEDFSIELLHSHTGYEPQKTFIETAQHLYRFL